MSAGNPAVFSEVLSLQVDSSQFAAMLHEVEAIYDASLERMQAATAEANIAGALAQQAADASSVWGDFFDMLERQMIRIPARATAFAVFAAALAPIVGVVADLVIGFDNLEEHSPDFSKTETSLKALNTEFASVAATPIFDYILEQMKALEGWLKENKVYLDNLALAFGQFATGVIKTLVDLATSDGVKALGKGVAEAGVSIMYAFSSALVTLRTLIDMVPALGKGLEGIGTNFSNITSIVPKMLKNQWTQTKQDFGFPSQPQVATGKDDGSGPDEIAALIKKHDEDQHALTVQALQMYAAIEGTANQRIPDVPTGKAQTPSEQKKEFEDRLASVKEYYAAVSGVIKESVASGATTYQQAAPILEQYITAEKTQIDALTQSYKNKAYAAFEANGKKPDANQITATQEDYDKTALAAKKALNQQYRQAETAADKEARADTKLLNEADLRDAEKNAAAKVAIVKKEVSEGLLTHRDGLAQEEVLEAKRHDAAVNRITQMPTTGPNEAARQQAAAAEEATLHQNNANALLSQHTEAVIADLNAELKAAEAINKTKEAYLESNLEIAKATDNKRAEIALTQQLTTLKLKDAQIDAQIAAAKAAYTETGSDQNQKAIAEYNAAQQRIAALEQQLNLQHYSRSAVGQQEFAQDNGVNQNEQTLQKFGVDIGAMDQDLQNANNSLQKLGAVLDDTVIPFLTNFAQGLSTAYADFKKGNIGGAIGGASKAAGGAAGAVGELSDSLSNSSGDLADTIGNALGSASSTIPLIGGMISGMFSAITGFFTTSIQNMVTDLQDQIQNINLQASTKQIGIQTQIAELKQAEQTAISELGGKKKAQSQLQSILQSLNSQIVQLQYQAQQTVLQFNDMVAAANGVSTAGQGVAEQWLSTWQSINQQVQAYVQAGGSIATAATYMNQQLQQQQMQLTDQLNQGNQTAIADALQLNQLEQNKVEMMQKEAQTEFGLLNSDSLERRTASAVATGQALTQQREAYAQQLTDLNYQIRTEQLKVTAETQVFNLATSTDRAGFLYQVEC